MNARPPLPLRRGACPGLSAPMPTGDGLLARLVPADAMPLDAFIALCRAARARGNGTMEVTARGCLQVRGLTPGSAPLFASEVAALGIAAHDGVAVLAGPLRDDPGEVVDSCGLAAPLRRAIAAAGLALAPKVSVIVDGGGRLHLDALSADVRLRAVGPAESPRLLVALGALLPLTEGGGARAACVALAASQRTPSPPLPLKKGEGARRMRGSGRSFRSARSMSWSASCRRLLRVARPRVRRMSFAPAASPRFVRASASNRLRRQLRDRRQRWSAATPCATGLWRWASGSRSAMRRRTRWWNWPAAPPRMARVRSARRRTAR
jgi:hypothetical protein